MRYVLENDCLKVEIDSFGAELKSVKSVKTGREFMWCGDKKYWGRTSPVLFPFVGSLKNKEYMVADKTYPMGQHGFARDMEFTLSYQDKDEILFELTSTEETLAKYPFKFKLEIGYYLEDNDVKVMWKVTNPNEDKLPFSIGAHPAFNCPINGEDDKYGYKLAFKGGLKEIHHHGNTLDTGLAITEDIVLPLDDMGMCEITPGFFDRCTYMIEGKQAGIVGLVDKSGTQYVTVFFNTPLFAIWSPEGKNAPFVCIEPWYGRCDHVDFEGDIWDREYTNVLNPQEVFKASYDIVFNDNNEEI